MAEFLTTEIADRYVPAFRRGFVAALDVAKQSVSLRRMEYNIRTVGDPRIDWAEFQDIFARHMIPLIEQVVKASGEAHVPPNVGKQKPAAIPLPAQEPVFTFSFDITNPEAVSWIREHAGILITSVTDETRMAVRALVQRSFQEGIAPRKLARMIRGHIGLTQGHSLAVSRYEANLAESVADGSITGDRATTLGERYRKRLLTWRANNIARSETIEAAVQGQLNLWSQMEQQGFLDKDNGYKAWLVTHDERLCWRCAPIPTMNGPIPRSQAFKTPVGDLMGPKAHQQCRCGLRLFFKNKQGRFPDPPSMPAGWTQTESGRWKPPRPPPKKTLKPRIPR